MSITNTWTNMEQAMMPVPIPPRYAGKIRSQQKSAFQSLLPFGLAASAINALVIFLYFGIHSPSLTIGIWGLIMVSISLLGARSGIKAAKKRITKDEVSTRALRRPVRECLLLGSVWALAPALLLPASGTWQISLLMTVCVGMMAGGAYMLSSIPRAAAVFVTLIALGILVGICRGGLHAQEIAIIALLASYTIVMVRSIYWNFGNLVQAWLQQLELAERATEVNRQKDVISLLLKDFEESASDYLWEIDEFGHIRNASDGLAELCQIPTAMMNGTSIVELLAETLNKHGSEYSSIKQSLANRKGFADLLVPVEVGGEQRWWNVTGKPLLEGDQYKGYRGVISDVTDARNAEARVAYLAHFDSLTDLPNRANFNDTLERCLYRHKANDEAFAVIFVDIDFFKTINDEHGHDVGDQLLRRAAQLMKGCVAEEDIVARIGGDEFAIVCRTAQSRRQVMALCDKIVDAFEQPMKINGLSIKVGASLGASICPTNADTMSELLKCADLALYRAKEDGRGCARFFEESMDIEARERRKLENELREAFAEGQFALHYQPLVDSITKEVKSFETLLRWNHPKRGQVSPNDFINLTEQTGMIVGIGEWVIRTALAEAATWDTDARISINLSPIQVKHRGLVPVVAQALAASRIDPTRVEFEITESVLLDDSSESMDRLHKLRSLGVNIALDDFGTGYSSLSYLRAFPFDRIKIDKSFVQSMDDSHECRAIVRAVAGLANSLGMQSTAEGVETIEQVEELTSDGCTELQGFYFSRPKPAEDLISEGYVTIRDDHEEEQVDLEPSAYTQIAMKN